MPISPDVVFNMVDSIGRERNPKDCDYEIWKAICDMATRLWVPKEIKDDDIWEIKDDDI